TGSEPGQTIDRTGASITYGVTMLDNAQNKEAAEAFLAYMFDPEGGLAILEAMGQPPFVPVRVPSQDMLDTLPQSLQPLVEVGE
ncbi:MAG: extracellular solute-binding protein, partial [Desulfovibrio sp.]